MNESRRPPLRILDVKVFLPILVAAGFLAWLLLTPSGFWGKLDAVGYSICHQQPERSYFFFGQKMPLCARCTGMYISAAVGFAVLGRKKRFSALPPKGIMIALGVILALFALDGINSLLSSLPINFILYQPTNWMRLLSGAALGISFPVILLPLFHQTAWMDSLDEAAVQNFKQFSFLLLIAMGCASLVLLQLGMMNAILSVISILSVVFILTLSYSMLWIIFLKKETRFTHFSQLWIWLTAGFGTALVQIGIFDALRYVVTGTWQSFQVL